MTVFEYILVCGILSYSIWKQETTKMYWELCIAGLFMGLSAGLIIIDILIMVTK